MELKAEILNPSDKQRTDFIIEQNHNNGYEIKEYDTEETIKDEETGEEKTITIHHLEAWGYTEEEKQEQRKEQFEKDFFNTSLGYIRRKVTMANGETKDFLSDLLPTISMGVTSGAEVKVIAYNEPDFTKEVIDWESLQHNEVVTSQFIQECFVQLSNDFGG